MDFTKDVKLRFHPELLRQNVLCSAAQSCLTLSDPRDCSPSGSSVHGIFQARTLEWIAISYSDIRHKILEKIKFFKKLTAVLFCVCV